MEHRCPTAARLVDYFCPVAKRLVTANGVGKQQPAPLDIFPQGLPLAVGEVEGVAAVHEDDRVVE